MDKSVLAKIILSVALLAVVFGGGALFILSRRQAAAPSGSTSTASDTVSEIMSLQQEVSNLEKRTSTGIVKAAPPTPRTIVVPTTITSADLAPYLGGVVNIICWNSLGNAIDSGSGVLWAVPDYAAIAVKYGGTSTPPTAGGATPAQNTLQQNPDGTVPNPFSATTYDVLTNQHVIKSSDCEFSLNATPDSGDYELLAGSDFTFNSQSDEALMEIDSASSNRTLINGDILIPPPNPPPISALDYAIGTLPHCPGEMAVGSPVAVIGYPATGETLFKGTDGNTYGTNNQIATLGTISGFDTSPYASGLPDVNYFVTAQMDAGNSGGAAIAKDSKGLCFLGLPTWVNEGTYANTGIVQSVNNVMFSPQ